MYVCMYGQFQIKITSNTNEYKVKQCLLQPHTYMYSVGQPLHEPGLSQNAHTGILKIR